jgi:hypothetical protein
MGGRALLFLVVGFSMIYLVLGQNFGSISNQAVTNMTNYYSTSVAHNIAESGANLAANQIFLNGFWQAGYNNIKLFNNPNSSLNVSVQVIDTFKNIKVITSTASYNGITSVVKVTLQPSHFSKFAYFSISENGVWWTNGDTVSGPFHTQDYLNSYGHPVFLGPSTSTLKGINYYTGNKKNDSPVIVGTFSTGVNIPIPSNGISNLDSLAKIGGAVFTGMDSVYLNFKRDSITYTTIRDSLNKSGKKVGVVTTVKTVPANTFAPNGVIFAENAMLRIKGVVKGQFTVGSSYNSTSTVKGSIYIDSSIVYNTDPRVNPSSTDLLGIAAQNYVFVADNQNNSNNVYIDAAIYAQNCGFGAQDYNNGQKRGTIYLLGGITQSIRQPVGIINGGYVTSGYNKNYTYDNRLLLSVPPSYPSTGGYEIISWYE